MGRSKRKRQSAARSRPPTQKTTDWGFVEEPYAAYPSWEAFALSASGGYGGEGRIGRTDYGRALAYQISGITNRCVDLKAQAANSMGWKIVRDSDGEEEIVATSEDRRPRHPAARAIHEVYVNQGVPLFSLWTYSRDLNGETYLEKTVNDGGVPGIRWLNPYWTEPIAPTGRITGFWYGAKENGFERHRAPADLIAYDRTYNPLDDIRGFSKVDAALSAINLSSDMQILVRSIIDNNARPGVIVSPADTSVASGLMSKGVMGDLQRQFMGFHRGRRNASNALLSPIALNVTPLEMPEIEKYYTIVDSLKKDICIVFGVPLAMAGDSSSTTFKDGEEVRQAFYINTVIPLLRMMQDFFNAKLMPYLDPHGDCTFQFDTAQFEDSTTSDKAVADLVTVQLQSGILLMNEARVAQGLAPLPELKGKVMINGVPTPLITLDQTPPALAPDSPITPPPVPNGPPVQPPDTTKDAPGMSVVLSLANDVDLLSLQRNLQAKFAGQTIRWTAPDVFHITLVSAPACDDAALEQLIQHIAAYPPPDLQVNIGSLASFDSLNEHAMHFRIRRNADLYAYQAEIYDLCQELGIQTGQYSLPQNWAPHITMGYSKQRIPSVTFQSRLRVSPSEVQVSVKRDGQYEVVGQVPCGDDAVTKSAHTHDHAYVFEKPLPPAEWREKALDELEACQKRARKGRKFQLAYTSHLASEADLAAITQENYTPFFDRMFAAVRYEPFKATCARLDRAFDPISRKDIGETRQEFEDEFLLAIADAKDGTITTSQLGGMLSSVIDNLGPQAFLDGLEDGGVVDPELDEDDKATIERLKSDAKGYIADFVSKFDTYTDLQLDQRPQLWSNKTLQGFYDHGLAAADANGMYIWRLGKTEVHCATCLAMEGIRKRMKRWLADGILPQSDKLECGGWHCDCGLFNVRGGARG